MAHTPLKEKFRITIILRPNRLTSFTGVVLLMLFFSVAAMGGSAASQSPQLKSSLKADDSVGHRSRLILNGVEYTKINLGELYQHCLNAKTDKMTGHYVVRGVVRRTPELDGSSQFALIRTAVVCCHSHAAPVGFRVDYNRSLELRDGQWIKVYGTLKRLSPDLPSPNLHSIGLLFTRFNKSYGIVPQEIVKIPKPEAPYILKFKDSEPYAY